MTDLDRTKAVVVDGIAYEYMADGTLKPIKVATDWDLVDALAEQDSDAETESLTDADWLNVKFVDPFKTPVTIRLDNEVISWFKNQGSRGYQTKINAVLRTYVEAQKKAG